MRLEPFAIAILCAVLVPKAARAGKTPDDIGIEDELELLKSEDVVVSPAKHAQPIDESAASVTVLTHDEIMASGYDNLGDLMRLVPGADVFRVSPSEVAVGLRGGSDLGGENLLVLVDGRDAALPGEDVPVWMGMPLDLDSIERIEIVRGPASTLYGANAFQGVVNIVTRPASKKPVSAEATVRAASASTASADLRVSGTRGRLTYWASGGYLERAPLDDPLNVQLTNLRGRARVGWRGKGDLQATLEIGDSQGSGVLATALGPAPTDISWPYLLGRLSIGRTRVLLSLEQTDFAGHLGSDLLLPQSGGLPAMTLARLSGVDLTTRSGELDVQQTLEPFHGDRLILGASGWLLRHTSKSVVTCPKTSDPQTFDPSKCTPLALDEVRAGIYAQDEWRITGDLIATAGLRFDWNSIHPEPGISPRLALVWRASASQVFRISAGRAYRKPAAFEAYVHFVPDIPSSVPTDVAQRVRYLLGEEVGNPALANATSTSVEIGWRGRFLGSKLTATVDAYGSRFDDRIMLVTHDLALVPGFGGVPTLPADASVLYVNVKTPLYDYGGEATIEARPLPWLRASLGYALDLGSALTAEPNHRLVASVRIALPVGLNAGLDAIWCSAYQDVAQDPRSIFLPKLPQTVGGEVLLDGTLSYKDDLGDGRDVEVGTSLFNLGGSRARDLAGIDVSGGGSYGAERLLPRIEVFVRGAL